jgi:hypothetical protein
MANDTSTGSTGSGATRRRSIATPKRKTSPSIGSKATRSTASGTPAPSAARTAAKPAATKPVATAAATKAATNAAAKTQASKPATKPAATNPAAKAQPVTKKAEVIVIPAAFDAHAGPMSPTIAVSRHLEWLDYALAAARAEESWRRGRLDNATKKNRSKRETRLAEVVAEIDELAALIVGLRGLQRPSPVRKPARRRSTGARRAATSPRTGARRTATTDTGAG